MCSFHNCRYSVGVTPGCWMCFVRCQTWMLSSSMNNLHFMSLCRFYHASIPKSYDVYYASIRYLPVFRYYIDPFTFLTDIDVLIVCAWLDTVFHSQSFMHWYNIEHCDPVLVYYVSWRRWLRCWWSRSLVSRVFYFSPICSPKPKWWLLSASISTSTVETRLLTAVVIHPIRPLRFPVIHLPCSCLQCHTFSFILHILFLLVLTRSSSKFHFRTADASASEQKSQTGFIVCSFLFLLPFISSSLNNFLSMKHQMRHDGFDEHHYCCFDLYR